MLAFAPGFIGIVGVGGDLHPEIQKLLNQDLPLSEAAGKLEALGLKENLEHRYEVALGDPDDLAFAGYVGTARDPDWYRTQTRFSEHLDDGNANTGAIDNQA
jgi:hypothetical protein